MGSFALALAGLGRLDEAHDAVCKAIEAAGGREDGQQWYVPELLRIKGDVLLRQSSNQAVQAAADALLKRLRWRASRAPCFGSYGSLSALPGFCTVRGVPPTRREFSSRFTTASPRGSRPLT